MKSLTVSAPLSGRAARIPVALLLCALCIPLTAQAAEVLAPPFWSSDQIRGARPTAAVPALVFDVQRTQKSGLERPTIVTETVTLTPGWIHVSKLRQDVLYDRTLCRSLTWTSVKTSLVNQSCFAVPAYRVAELASRRARAKAAAPKAPLIAAYWPEAELGVLDNSSLPIQKLPFGGVTEYRVGAEVLARTAGSAAAISPDEMRAFVRYLAQEAQVHPRARQDLAAATAIPERIDTYRHSAAGEAIEEVMVISKVRRANLPYPLPGGLTADLEAAAPVSVRGVRQAVAAATGRSTIPKPGENALVAAIAASLKARQPVAALFAFFNLTDQYGGRLASRSSGQAELLKSARAQFQTVLADPQAARFWAVSQLAADPMAPGDRQAAAVYLGGLRLDATVPYASFRLVTLANLVNASGDTRRWGADARRAIPEPLASAYWSHIAAYPWAANTYGDLGALYFRNLEVANAWLAFDLGRAVDPDWRLGALGRIGAFEDQLKAAKPELF